MKKGKRPFTFHSIILAVVCALFLFSGCGASKNMLAAIFGGDAGKPGPGLTASDAQLMVDPDAGYRLARHFQKNGRHQLAVNELLKVIKADPGHVSAYNALGVSYDQLREFDLAEAAYREALRIDPKLDYVYNNIGYSNLLQGNLEASASAFKTAVALNTEKKLYQNNLALAHARLGKDPADPEDPAPAQQTAALIAARPDDDTSPSAIIVMDITNIENTSAAAAPQTDLSPSGDAAQVAAVDPQQPQTYYTIQLGVYYDLDTARRAMEKARENGLDSPYITRVDRGDGYAPYFRVRSGQYHSQKTAAVAAAGISGTRLNPAFGIFATVSTQAFYAFAEPMPATDLETPAVASLDRLPVIIQSNRDIEILNGNGVRHMARDFQQYLTGRGFEVDHIANADHFRHPRTVIYYSPGYYGRAKQLLAEIQKIEPAGRMVKSGGMDRNIRIVLGRDIMGAAEKLDKNS